MTVDKTDWSDISSYLTLFFEAKEHTMSAINEIHVQNVRSADLAFSLHFQQAHFSVQKLHPGQSQAASVSRKGSRTDGQTD